MKVIILFLFFGGQYCICYAQQTATFKDSRDGKKYKTITIGKQIWMAENLNFETKSGSWCYNDSTENCKKFGRLYDWETAKIVCPSADGWHLPETDEWRALTEYLGGMAVGGDKMKNKGSQNWNCPNAEASNSSGFSAFPGGSYNAEEKTFEGKGNTCAWWSATEESKAHAWFQYMYCDDPAIYRNNYGSKPTGCSVRCLKKK
ncbi:MAG: hypothetical protein A2309_04595 [Bacteroidetes bacterium RIFOXYB2_FULL_35_7]|nr:MAG: hypothetical protein A2X01_10035 [Bacteroidetes bacterium GWF2_35_48]OFY96600.1 MAG: hypothetical protein A2309_04595 [Bacteroidetes bacterium RIFOXYB2_FULL_35_7]OFY97983.1 MAG: hypothetical protein A2491_19060 [Bacteroidetes bacterium RIFOXYC12_FULL_35_7]HBX52369.1 hypothetical protein [Bacteroidales bacterium]